MFTVFSAVSCDGGILCVSSAAGFLITRACVLKYFCLRARLCACLRVCARLLALPTLVGDPPVVSQEVWRLHAHIVADH